MVIRKARPGRLGEVLAGTQVFDHPLDPVAVDRYVRCRSNHLWIAIADGRTVGFLRGSELLQVETRRPQFFLYEIAVERRLRRRGVGTALVRAMLAFARHRGHEEAFVFTSPHNRAAVRLYRSTGAVTETVADRMFVYRLRSRSRKSTPRRARGALAQS